MAKHDKNASFLGILLPLAALIVTSYLVIQQTNLLSKARTPQVHTYTYNLQKGYNSIAIPLETNLTITDICERLNLEEVWRYENYADPIGPRKHDCSVPHEGDIAVLPHEGIIFELETEREWTIQGTKAKSEYNIASPSLYMYGFPQAERKTLYAQDICNSKVAKGLEISEVYYLDSDNYTTHICDTETVNNFEVKYGIAYSLMVTEKDSIERPTQVTLPE